MKKNFNVEDAKSMVEQLLGHNVDVRLNRGRNKIKHYAGVVAEAHSNVFVIQLTNEIFDRISCSYVDVVCGEIALKDRATT